MHERRVSQIARKPFRIALTPGFISAPDSSVFPKLRLKARKVASVNGCYRLLTFQSTIPLTTRKRHKTQPPPGAKPFSSALWPYLTLITQRRLTRATWGEIAEEISAAGTPVTRQGVHVFFKRCKQREKRRGSSYALGTEPANAGFAARLGTEASQEEGSSDLSVQPMTAIDEMIAHARETTRIAKYPKIKTHKPKPDAQL